MVFVENCDCSGCPYWDKDSDGEYTCTVTFDYEGCQIEKERLRRAEEERTHDHD